MNQEERRVYLIEQLLSKNRIYEGMQIPEDTAGRKQLLRALFNVRIAAPISERFAQVQDAYLQQENAERGIVRLQDLTPVREDLYLWQGDITRLQVGAVVNAANSGMTGCYHPNHACIDNCIHTFAGIQLRNTCAEIMEKQGHEEPTGTAKLTPAFNLPCDYVIHTVGPIVQSRLTEQHEEQLRSCYEACLKTADAHEIGSIAFCCISTGVFLFPNERAAQIAVQTVKEYKQRTGSRIRVIFDVFRKQDLDIYTQLLND